MRRTDKNCSRKFIQGSAEIMLHQEHWSVRLTGKVSFGQPLSQMQTSSSANVKDASISLGRYTCRRKNCRPSQLLGLSQSGASTWSALCRERPVVTHTSSSLSINSPSGSKPNPSPRSQPPRLRNSSKTLWSDSAFPTGSLRTTAHSSLGLNSKIGAKSSASRSAMLLWHTHRVTGRSSVPMAWCSRASSQGFSIGSNLTQASGRENGHPCSGRYGLVLAEPLANLLSS